MVRWGKEARGGEEARGRVAEGGAREATEARGRAEGAEVGTAAVAAVMEATEARGRAEVARCRPMGPAEVGAAAVEARGVPAEAGERRSRSSHHQTHNLNTGSIRHRHRTQSPHCGSSCHCTSSAHMEMGGMEAGEKSRQLAPEAVASMKVNPIVARDPCWHL